MTKKNEETKNNAPKPPQNVPAPPKGMARRNDDVSGFWSGMGPILFVPLTVKAFDNKLNKLNPSLLIIGELLAECQGVDENGDDTILPAGGLVGVWGKPGMRAIKNSKGVRTWINPTGEKDIGKGMPMKTFDVYSDDGGEELTIDEDRREHSALTETWLNTSLSARVRAARESRQRSLPGVSDNDIPVDENGKPLF